MFGILDALGEIGGALPYLYRGWFWLISKEYRKVIKSEYKNHSKFYKIFDAALSFLVLCIECWLIYAFIYWLINENT